MSTSRVQFIISLIFLLGYMLLIGVILIVEVSDTVNMVKGQNTMMGEVKILLGVLTGAVGQILNFWFNKDNMVPVAEAPRVVEPPRIAK